MTPTRGGFCRKLMADAGEWSCQGRIGPERMAGEFVRFFAVSLRPTMAELKALLREAGFGEVSEAGHLPGGMRGVHYTSPHGGYDIRYLADQPEGARVHTVLHETYEIIHETLCDLHADSPPPRTVCVEANRFAAAALLQPGTFSLFARASGYDVPALQKQYGCSYATATLRLDEVMRRQPLVAVLYEREEEGEIAGWDRQPPPSRFMASVVVRTPGFGMRDGLLLCGERGGRPRKGKSVSPGSLAHRVLLTGSAAYAERKPGVNGAGPSDLAVAARPVLWSGRLAKIALVAVPYRDRAALRPQLAHDSFERMEDLTEAFAAH